MRAKMLLKQNFVIQLSPFKGNEKGFRREKAYKILLPEVNYHDAE